MRLNTQIDQPKAQTMFDLVTHAPGGIDPLGCIEGGWVVKRPMFVDSHVEEDCRAVLFRIRADSDDMTEIDPAHVFHHRFGPLPGGVYAHFLQHLLNFGQNDPLGFCAGAEHFKMFARQSAQQSFRHLAAG